MHGKMLLSMNYHRLHHLFFQCISKTVGNPFVHPGQASLLGCLLDQGSISQGELCRTLKVSAAAVAVSLRRLEQQGMILRLKNPSDLREKLLRLTPLGIQTAKDIRVAVDKVQSLAIQGFSNEELESLLSYLSRIVNNLNTFLESDCPEKNRTNQGE
jgi:DNA-binding MarR family transcriptional regulator